MNNQQWMEEANKINRTLTTMVNDLNDKGEYLYLEKKDNMRNELARIVERINTFPSGGGTKDDLMSLVLEVEAKLNKPESFGGRSKRRRSVGSKRHRSVGSKRRRSRSYKRRRF